MTAGDVTVTILFSVEAIGFATSDRTFDISVVCFDVFAIIIVSFDVFHMHREQKDEALSASSYLLELMPMEISLATVRAR